MPTTRSSAPVLIGRRELAQLFGNVSYSTVSCWHRIGLDAALVERGGHGALSRYDLDAALDWFRTYSATRPWLKIDQHLLAEFLPPKRNGRRQTADPTHDKEARPC